MSTGRSRSHCRRSQRTLTGQGHSDELRRAAVHVSAVPKQERTSGRQPVESALKHISQRGRLCGSCDLLDSGLCHSQHLQLCCCCVSSFMQAASSKGGYSNAVELGCLALWQHGRQL